MSRRSLVVIPAMLIALCAVAAAGPASAGPNVRIWAVDPAGGVVHLKNFGDASQTMSNWWLCNFPNYSSFSATLGPGEAIAVGFPFANPADAELGLYTTNSFANSSAMVDYLEWGSPGHQRSSVAVAAGVWFVGDVVNVAPPFGYTGDGSQYGDSFWSTAAANVRIIEADTSLNSLRLRNLGTATQDVGSWWLCSLFGYAQLGTLPATGSLIMPPGGELTVQWGNVNATPRDMGLYRTSLFGSASAMVDFLQWGSGGNGRESVAVAAGYWGAGDFIAGGSPYTFIGGDTEYGVSSWSSVLVGAGTVPDGKTVPGVQLTLDKGAGPSLELVWGASCRTSDTDYGIYEGGLGGSFLSHTLHTCSTSGAPTATISPAVGSTYYLVVPQASSVEGSYGVDSGGTPRPSGVATCLPQDVAGCS